MSCNYLSVFVEEVSGSIENLVEALSRSRDDDVLSDDGLQDLEEARGMLGRAIFEYAAELNRRKNG